MSRLIHTGIIRYLKSKIYWMAVIATIILSLSYFNEDVISFQFLVFAIVTTWDICQEYLEGGFSDKLIVGYTKKDIFLSELIISILANLFLFIIFTIVFSITHKYIFVVMPASIMIKCLIVTLMAVISIITIGVAVSNLVSHKVLSIFVFVAVLLFIYIGDFEIYSELVYRETAGKTIKNCYEVIHDTLPTSTLENSNEIVRKYLDYPSEHPWYKLAIKMDLFEQDDISQEENKMLNMSIIYSLGAIVVFTGLGYYLFNKKELK